MQQRVTIRSVQRIRAESTDTINKLHSVVDIGVSRCSDTHDYYTVYVYVYICTYILSIFSHVSAAAAPTPPSAGW